MAASKICTAGAARGVFHVEVLMGQVTHSMFAYPHALSGYGCGMKRLPGRSGKALQLDGAL